APDLFQTVGSLADGDENPLDEAAKHGRHRFGPETERAQTRIDRAGARAAAAVPQNDHDADAVAEGVESEIDASHADVAEHVASDADHEQVVEALAEQHLGRDAGVGAA